MADDTLLRQYEIAYGPFTHMSPAEKSIWLRYLQEGGTTLAPFLYDIRVGSGLQMPADSSDYAKKAAYALTTKRIDVMFTTPLATWIVEVKVRAGLSAIGQLIGYRDLYKQTSGFTGNVMMLLVTDTLQPDMGRVLGENGIAAYIVKS